MKKLRLRLDALTVETFPVEQGQMREQGTVHARADTELCGDTPNTICQPPTTECYPSVDRTWCGCGSVWCGTD